MKVVEKPWGVDDLGPWNGIPHGAAAIGELWFETAGNSSLLLKLLFTSQPLSIQVHPTDAFARSIGLAHGKSEAWYILHAEAGAEIAIGLQHPLTALELRDAITDGSIAERVQWRPVATGDFFSVPAGTIHALGAGLTVLEVQQRSDTTFRLFDFGRNRALDVDEAVATADAGPADPQSPPARLTDARTLLLANAHFTIERIDLPPFSDWEFSAEAESWVFALGGGARFGDISVQSFEAIFVRMTSPLKAGAHGFRCLVAYADSWPNPMLLRNDFSAGAKL
jgi:mannose-6-phosphate isomerase